MRHKIKITRITVTKHKYIVFTNIHTYIYTYFNKMKKYIFRPLRPIKHVLQCM